MFSNGALDYAPSVERKDSWTEESPLGEIRVNYRTTQKSAVDQMFEESMEFEVNGKLVGSSTNSIYFRYPNEFALLQQSQAAQWEIVGSFNNWNFDAPVLGSSEINHPLCILRRRA